MERSSSKASINRGKDGQTLGCVLFLSDDQLQIAGVCSTDEYIEYWVTSEGKLKFEIHGGNYE